MASENQATSTSQPLPTPAPKSSKRNSTLLSRLLPSRSKPPSIPPSASTTQQSPSTSSPPPSTSSTLPNPQPPIQGRLLRVLVIGAGSRGHAYAAAIATHNRLPPTAPRYIPAVVVGVAETDAFKRQEFGGRFVWAGREERAGEAFEGWREWVEWEKRRRESVKKEDGDGKVEEGIDAVFVCVLDEMHVEVVEGIKELGGVHIMCEKPLATSLDGCVRMWRAAQRETERDGEKVFGICHVLRYSPHNIMLRELVKEKEVVGEVVSVEHTEPVGWWHFSHSYVRGNWRKESKTAPSLLTKSCHDIDWLLWMLCSPTDATSSEPAHLPAYISSTGSLKFFRKERKPAAAGNATNCLSCPIEKDCVYSAKKIYLEKRLEQGDTDWPVNIVKPEIEECYRTGGLKKAVPMLLKSLGEDYGPDTPAAEVEARPWYGRCVWETDNDVCDDQFVTISWDDDPRPAGPADSDRLRGRVAKSASFHMIAFTENVCHRRGRIYGTKGEITYDSTNIWVHDFASGKTEKFTPEQQEGGHGGGDSGLARQFLRAVDAVINHGEDAGMAQRKHLGCTLEDVIRSHAMVFAAEDARLSRRVLDWPAWWRENVEEQLHPSKGKAADANGMAN